MNVRKVSAELKKRFIDECYDGDKKAYLKARKDDYCKVQYEWSCWMDALCKNGEISQEAWNKVTF